MITNRLVRVVRTVPAGLQPGAGAADEAAVPDAVPAGLHPVLTNAARLAVLRTTGLLDALPSEEFDRLARIVVRTTGATGAVVSLVDDRRRVMLSATGLPATWSGRRESPVSGTLCGRVVETGRPVVFDDLTAAPASHRDDLGAAAYAGVPLRTREGHVLGALAAVATRPKQWTAEDIEALTDVAGGVLSEVELRRLAQRLTAEGRTDHLTGLGNRRQWQEDAEREVTRARAAGQPLVLALLDLDRFRRFNDRYGTQAGDSLLQDIASRWRASLREGDGLARLGGVQFGLLMPGTALDPAFDIVERLRSNLSGGVTCSAALAMLRVGEDADALLARADDALVRAKRSGRNVSTLAA